MAGGTGGLSSQGRSGRVRSVGSVPLSLESFRGHRRDRRDCHMPRGDRVSVASSPRALALD
jgi:hypothetical protein